mmetsp:Transcript_24785/g.57759  ORF Transcript_24785/g.57759 Transcript_24785/m.57759 type:complete len:283 (+) Transcript_24785:1123-1971(+)
MCELLASVAQPRSCAASHKLVESNFGAERDQQILRGNDGLDGGARERFGAAGGARALERALGRLRIAERAGLSVSVGFNRARELAQLGVAARWRRHREGHDGAVLVGVYRFHKRLPRRQHQRRACAHNLPRRRRVVVFDGERERIREARAQGGDVVAVAGELSEENDERPTRDAVPRVQLQLLERRELREGHRVDRQPRFQPAVSLLTHTRVFARHAAEQPQLLRARQWRRATVCGEEEQRQRVEARQAVLEQRAHAEREEQPILARRAHEDADDAAAAFDQ